MSDTLRLISPYLVRSSHWGNIQVVTIFILIISGKMRVMIQIWQLWCSLVWETNKRTLNLDILITFGLSGVYNLLQSSLALFSAAYFITKKSPFTPPFRAVLKETTYIFLEKQVDVVLVTIYLLKSFQTHTDTRIIYTLMSQFNLLGNKVASDLWKSLQ